MNTVKITAAAMILFSVSAFAEKSPSEWQSVNKELIEKWKKDFNAPSGVYTDAKNRTVHFLMETTGVRTNDTIEFFAIGPLSDRAYESFGVTVASPADIVKAVEKTGIPCGTAVNQRDARFWPQGEKIKLEFAKYDGTLSKHVPFNQVLRDAAEKDSGNALLSPLVWTGGERDGNNAVVASTNIPCAVMAFYSLGQSPILLNGIFDQSTTYGRFYALEKHKPGELLDVMISWDGKKKVQERTVEVSTENVLKIITALRADAKNGNDVYVKVVFGKDTTVGEAKTMAKGFDMLDGNGIKLNGFEKGSFFVKAFLPDEKWRNRPERIFQPFEIHLKGDGSKSFIFIEEDWSGDGIDPVLKPRETKFNDWSEVPSLIAKTGKQGEKISVLFIYAPKNTKVSDITSATSLAPRIDTFYIFTE